jgi:hypothetical protein
MDKEESVRLIDKDKLLRHLPCGTTMRLMIESFPEEKLVNDEPDKLVANEALLNSRGYYLMVVTAEGKLCEVHEHKDLNDAELLGLQTFVDEVITGILEDDLDDEG